MDRNSKGSVLVLGLLIMAMLLLFGGIFLSLTTTNYQMITVSSDLEKLRWIAGAGVNHGIYGIKKYYFEPEKFIPLLKEWSSGKDFGDGKYRIGIVPVIGLGIREISIVSESMLKEDHYAVLKRVVLSAPTDYVLFYNGNGYIGVGTTYMYIKGPIHANGSLGFDVVWQVKDNQNYRIWIMKDPELKGPVVSASGDIFRIDPIPGWYNQPVVIGVAKLPWLDAYNGVFGNSAFINGTDRNDLNLYPDTLFGVDATGFDFSKKPGLIPTWPVPKYSSPIDITFPYTRQDGHVEKLLMDGNHGGYSIGVPDKDKIFESFMPFIDKRWYITYSNTAGGYHTYFYNYAHKEKTILNKRSATEFEFVNRGTERIGSVWQNSILQANVANWFFPPTTTYKYAKLYQPKLSMRAIKNVYINNTILVNPSNYYIQYRDYFRGYSYDINNCVIFNPAFPVSAGSVLYLDKIRDVYLVKENGGTFWVSSEAYDIDNTNNLVKFKTNINERPKTMDGGMGNVYITANGNLIKLNTLEVTEEGSNICLDPTVVNNFYTDNIQYSVKKYVNGNITFKDENSYPWQKEGQEWGSPLGCTIEYDGRIYDNEPFAIYRKPLTTGTQSTVRDPFGNLAPAYNPSNKILWAGLPQIPGSGRDANGNLLSDSSMHLMVYDRTLGPPVGGNDKGGANGTLDGGLAEILPSGAVIQPASGPISNLTGSYPWILDPNHVRNYGIENSAMIVFTGTAPTINSDQQFLISYRANHRQITNVKADIYDPLSSGYQNVGIAKDVHAIALDLTTIPEANYPEEGVIFSEVPLIVYGVPKKKITIVCMDDVYIGPINASYYKRDGKVERYTFTDDDEQLKPVGIISAKAVWKYYGLNYNGPVRSNGYLEGPATGESVTPVNQSWEDLDPWSSYLPYYVILADVGQKPHFRKVVVYTQGSKLYSIGGFGLIGGHISGSIIYPSVLDVNDQTKLKYLQNYYTDFLITNYLAEPDIVYPKSFRKDLPPHIPVDMKIYESKPGNTKTVAETIDKLKGYLSEGKDFYTDSDYAVSISDLELY